VKIRTKTQCGFTLIEVMIVIAIVAMVVTAGIPMMWKAMAKDQLGKAVHDVIEGCKLARDRAILHNRPYDFVIRVQGETQVDMNVEAAKIKDPSGLAFAGSDQPLREPGSLMGEFPRAMGDEVKVTLLDVNFVDHMGAAEAHVRFYPNGTSDEFTIIMERDGVQRHVRADIIAGSVYEVVK
jgi:prepilin-type N-terminal cleavage/methylation domain-containing protein